MPTITTTGRAVIGGSPEDFRQPRALVKTSTGMNLPPLRESKPEGTETAPTQKIGQPGTTEEGKTGEVTLSPQLTALARKQQKLQAEIQAQRDREAAWTAKEADYVPKSSLQAKAKQNVNEALQEALGMDYEAITQLVLSQGQDADPLGELRSEVQQMKKSQEENVNKQYEATLKQYRAEAESLISSDPKAFHFINKGKHQDVVVQHIVETWEENPDKILTVEQAAKEVEEFLRADAKEKADALRELDPPQEEETKPAQKTLPPPRPQAPRTLTNQVESSPTRTYNQFQHMSMKERIAQSIARTQK